MKTYAIVHINLMRLITPDAKVHDMGLSMKHIPFAFNKYFEWVYSGLEPPLCSSRKFNNVYLGVRKWKTTRLKPSEFGCAK